MSKTDKSPTDEKPDAARRLARVLAPEDVRPGQYVSVLYTVGEIIPFFVEPGAERAATPLRYTMLPRGGLAPMRVLDVCLPFVLVANARGGHATLDVRRHKLARVSRRFGQMAFKRLPDAEQGSEKSADSRPKSAS